MQRNDRYQWCISSPPVRRNRWPLKARPMPLRGETAQSSRERVRRESRRSRATGAPTGNGTVLARSSARSTRCHQCRSRPRPRASPRIRHQRGSRRHRLFGRRGPRPEVPRLHECGARANHNSRPIQRPANSESRSRVVPRRRPALRGKRAPALAPRIAAGSCPAYSPQPAQTRSDAAGRRTMPACKEAGVPQADRRLRLG